MTMGGKRNIVIATTKNWNIRKAYALCRELEAAWNFSIITDPKEFFFEKIKSLDPLYIFFPHWSWIIPECIFSNWECVVFHVGDVPEGRGGSPLQNHILRGIYDTKISAIKVDAGLDTGPVYMKRSCSLYGGAEEIFLRISDVVFCDMIPHILNNRPCAMSQRGVGSFYPRRNPLESKIKDNGNINSFFDYIRMLDAEGYPKAFIEYGAYRLLFSRPKLMDGKILADVEITLKEDNSDESRC